MKIVRNVLIGFLAFCAITGGILRFLWPRITEKTHYVAADAPVRTISLPLPFPTGLMYQASPDSTVLIGTHKREPALFDISAFDRATARKLWQLPFVGNVVGQTEQQVLVYVEKTATVYFINPRTGQITRKISPEPAPLTSPSSLYRGMAFTDNLYITTKPLYQDVTVNGKFDTSWRIGLTAKTWETNEQTWFLPPVNQIIIIEYPPVVLGNKMLVVNPQRKIREGHSYQIISLETGKELHRSATEGTYFPLANDQFFEVTNTAVQRLDPFTQREIWRIDGAFAFSSLWSAGDQLTILARHPNGSHNTLRIVKTDSGQLLYQVDLPFFSDSVIKGAYLTRDKELLLRFEETNFKEPGTRLYDYWVCYDPLSQKSLWRTDFHSESFSNLLPFIHL